MTLADKLHPAVPMLSGFAPQPVPVLITYGVLLECKIATGVDMLPGVNPASCSAALLRALIWASVRRSGREITLREVGARIRPAKLPALRSLMVAAFAASLPDRVPRKKAGGGKSDGKPPKPKPPMTWIEVHAVARIQFGLTEEEWLAITPRQFAEFRTAYQERTRDIEQMIATLTAHTINFSARGPERMIAARRFMLHPPEEEPQDETPVTGEDIMEVFAAIRTGKN